MDKPSFDSPRLFIPFLLFLLILSVVYSPVLYFDYLFHDDGLFWLKLKELGFKYFFHHLLIAECRYSMAWLLSLENIFVHKVSDLRSLRFLAIVLSSCSASLLFRQMRCLSFSNIRAFLIISALFFLPGFADIFFYGSYSAIFSLCVLLACWSFHKVESGKGTVLPVLSFLAAITIYPPVAMFYWTMTGMCILFTTDRFSVQFKNTVLRLTTRGLIGLVIYAASVLWMKHLVQDKIGDPLYNPFIITPHGFSKLLWFFQEPMENVLNLWDIFPKTIPAITLCGGIIFTGLAVLFKKLAQAVPSRRKDLGLTCLWQTGLFIFVFFLTFLPNLAASGNAAFYRCLIPLTSLVWLLLIWVIFQWMSILPMLLTKGRVLVLLSLITVYAGTMTNQNVLYYRVLPSYIEYNAYKSMAEEVRLKNIPAVHIILLPRHNLLIKRYDEFGGITSEFSFDIYCLLYCAFKEIDGAKRHPTPLLYLSFPNKNVLIKVREIYAKKLPDGKWVGRDIGREDQFQEIDPSKFKNLFDQRLNFDYSFQVMPSTRQNWYTLNLNDLF